MCLLRYEILITKVSIRLLVIQVPTVALALFQRAVVNRGLLQGRGGGLLLQGHVLALDGGGHHQHEEEGREGHLPTDDSRRKSRVRIFYSAFCFLERNLACVIDWGAFEAFEKEGMHVFSILKPVSMPRDKFRVAVQGYKMRNTSKSQKLLDIQN